MEVSQNLHQTIDELRYLPQQTPEQSLEKREQAKLLRMEVFLDDAKCRRLLVTELRDNPALTVEELRTKAQKNSLVAHPDLLEAFINDLSEKRKKVAETLVHLDEKSLQSGKDKASLLYELVVPSTDRTDPNQKPKPQGEIRMGDQFPLAVTLYVYDRDDFARINEREFSLTAFGSYQDATPKDSLATMFAKLKGNFIDFPFIVLRGSEPSHEEHERGHAEQRSIINAVKMTDKKFVWGNLDRSSFDSQTLIELWKQDPQCAHESSHWKNIETYAFSLAKDEFLAIMKELIVANNMRVLTSTISTRLHFGPEYQFLSRLGIPNESDIYQSLRREYIDKLEVTIESVGHITQAYRNFGLGDRTDLLRWVLMRIPLERWQEQLRDTLFTSEADLLFQMDRYCFDRSIEDEERQKRYSILEKCREDLQQKQDRPLIPIIRQYANSLGMEN